MPNRRTRPLYSGSCFNIGDSVAHQMVRLVAMLRREADARMAALDLTDAQWKPLWFLHAGRATTPNELAREMDVDGGAVTRLLDRLESKGLLVRTRSDTDRRVVQLALTEAGRAAAAQIPPVLASVNNDFLDGFSSAEWQQLRGLLDRMLVNGEALSGPATPTS
ncbi:MarR family winged helix-turn-helix transcriptional regulator [Aquabacterium sp. OR-4]|uniref:MarR family winged helix-turn-helix transcriptional regulator n=1 Tax=Aquabacterium sp. OR-4 TaxID=2978127 RepID=UPI0028C54DE8|nr:MarR family transcriptional regulator [Aquabacterium sp. OR-4]MDT7837108.1 MarR family transcriptional regulator [Aquabacterium sp. OR-4]